MYGYDYSYDYSYTYQELDEFLRIFFGVFVVLVLIAVAVGIAFYVLQSFGTYTIAKRRGIHNPWLAWIPVANLWILGSISDQYQYVVKGNVRNRRKVLLGLSIPVAALSAIVMPTYIAAMGAAVLSEEPAVIFRGFGAVLAVNSILSVMSIVFMVFQYIALYDLFNSCDPENAPLFLVLSILFTVALPFFIFFSRKKDLGMPPRKSQPQAAPRQIPEPPAWQQSPEEPWEN